MTTTHVGLEGPLPPSCPASEGNDSERAPTASLLPLRWALAPPRTSTSAQLLRPRRQRSGVGYRPKGHSQSSGSFRILAFGRNLLQKKGAPWRVGEFTMTAFVRASPKSDRSSAVGSVRHFVGRRRWPLNRVASSGRRHCRVRGHTRRDTRRGAVRQQRSSRPHLGGSIRGGVEAAPATLPPGLLKTLAGAPKASLRPLRQCGVPAPLGDGTAFFCLQREAAFVAVPCLGGVWDLHGGVMVVGCAHMHAGDR